MHTSYIYRRRASSDDQLRFEIVELHECASVILLKAAPLLLLTGVLDNLASFAAIRMTLALV
jgi:hypothetical protein